jgi:hypothetical protein
MSPEGSLTPSFVGRDSEMRLLRQAFEESAAGNEQNAETARRLVYCASPSGAFVGEPEIGDGRFEATLLHR